jgi:hypothetical protein
MLVQVGLRDNFSLLVDCDLGFVGLGDLISMPNTFHYTDRQGWNAIGSQKAWPFKASQPKDPDRPVGAYFTDIEPTEENLRTLYKRIRIPKVKQEFVFWFVGREGLTQLFGGRGRDKRIFFSANDYYVSESMQRHGDKTEGLLGEFE